MYVRRIGITVPAGRVADANTWSARREEYLKAQKGFQENPVLRYLGYPGRRALLRTWDSRDSYLAWYESPESQGWLQANPADGAFTVTDPGRAYEVIHDVGDLSKAVDGKPC